MQAAQRRGSTEELSVLIAQYSLLVRRQASLRDVFQVRKTNNALSALCPTARCLFRAPVFVTRNDLSASQQGAVQHVWAITFNCWVRQLETR